MIKLILLIQALCAQPNPEYACIVQWVGDEVVITGYHEDEGVKCKILNTADIDCVWGKAKARKTNEEGSANHDAGVGKTQEKP